MTIEKQFANQTSAYDMVRIRTHRECIGVKDAAPQCISLSGSSDQRQFGCGEVIEQLDGRNLGHLQMIPKHVYVRTSTVAIVWSGHPGEPLCDVGEWLAAMGSFGPEVGADGH